MRAEDLNEYLLKDPFMDPDPQLKVVSRPTENNLVRLVREMFSARVVTRADVDRAKPPRKPWRRRK